MSKKLSKFVHQMSKSDFAPAEVQICPECSGTLHVTFGAYGRGYGITVTCDDCEAGLAADFTKPYPKWLKQK